MWQDCGQGFSTPTPPCERAPCWEATYYQQVPNFILNKISLIDLVYACEKFRLFRCVHSCIARRRLATAEREISVSSQRSQVTLRPVGRANLVSPVPRRCRSALLEDAPPAADLFVPRGGHAALLEQARVDRQTGHAKMHRADHEQDGT